VILVVSALTANDETFPIGFCYIYDVECRKSWRLFLRFLLKHIPELDDKEGTALSDGLKGIELALADVLRMMRLFRCFVHKFENLLALQGLQPKHKKAALTAYKGCVHAYDHRTFDAHWANLPSRLQAAIESEGKDKFFPLFHPNNLHGRIASSPVESVNRQLKERGIRSMPPTSALLECVQMCDDWLRKQQDTAVKFSLQTNKEFPGMPPNLWERNRESQRLMLEGDLMRRTSYSCARDTWRVGKLTDHSSTVDVDIKAYTCCKALKFDPRTACVHYQAACRLAHVPVAQHMPPYLTEETWRQQLMLPPLPAGAPAPAVQRPVYDNQLPDFHGDILQQDPLGTTELLLVPGLSRVSGRPQEQRNYKKWSDPDVVDVGRHGARAHGRRGKRAPQLGEDEVEVVNEGLRQAAAKIPAHRYAGVSSFDPNGNGPVMVQGYNQRLSIQTGQTAIRDEHAEHRLCCACYQPGVPAQPLIQADTSVCPGCLCIIHPAGDCDKATYYEYGPDDENFGNVWCSHCLHKKTDYAQQTPQPPTKKPRRCGLCHQTGHYKSTCPNRGNAE